MPRKPKTLQVISVLWIVDGFLSIAWGLGLAGAAISSIIGILCLPVALYPFILGIVEVIYGIKLSNDPVRLNQAPTFVSIMEIANIVLGDVIGLTVGIITLILLKDESVKLYFDQVANYNNLSRKA